uniref:Uncharacterized protein n=1 Tax=Caenorhabditis japonica TaxID=281687 RepID=A0A8R1HUH6_CAEJA
MNMADVSIRSNRTVLSRGTRPESGRLHRKYPYRWLFEQVHVKSLIFHVEVGLLAIAIFGLYHASQMSPDQSVEPISVPGFDGLLWPGSYSHGLMKRPNYQFAMNILNVYSYFLIISVICGFVGMRLSETSVARRKFPPHMNPASLLIPSVISVISFLYPLVTWTLRTLQSSIKVLIKDNMKTYSIMDSCRMVVVPVILIWVVYIYFLYGVWLGVLYYQRRGDQTMPTSPNSLLRRPLRKQHVPFRSKANSNLHLLSELTAVSIDLSPSSPSCVASPTSTGARQIISVSPRSFRQLETVDEEAQSRTSSD